MKILYDYQIFYNQRYGGPSRYFVELIKELINLNYDLKVISPIYINNHLKELNQKYVLGSYFENTKNMGYIFKLYNELRIKYFIKKNNFDIIHSTYYKDIYNTKNPLVITVYDLIHEIFSYEYNFNDLPKKKIIEKAEHLICISENTKNDLIKFYNVPEHKVSVVYLANYLKKKSNDKIKTTKPFFLYVGSRKRYKNFSLLVNAYKKLKKINENYNIVCFGGGNFLKEEILNFKDKNIDIKKLIYLEGDDELLSKLYNSAEAYICTSKYEGFGLPVLEAMSHGCPVICSNSSSLPEVYGNAALSFNPNSEENLEECINNFLNNSSLKDKMIESGHQRVKNFSWKKCAEETSKIYKSLI